jgi:hypothetical protein
VKASGAKGCISHSAKTTDERDAYRFANRFFQKRSVAVPSGQDIKSGKVGAAIDEFTEHLAQVEKRRLNLTLKSQFLNRTKRFFASARIKENNTKMLSDLKKSPDQTSRNQTLAPTSSRR